MHVFLESESIRTEVVWLQAGPHGTAVRVFKAVRVYTWQQGRACGMHAA